MSQYNLEKTIPALERSIEFFRPHHLELRKRLIVVCGSIIGCTVVAYIFAEKIAALFISPLFKASPLVYKLVYTNLPEAFLAYIKLALLVGVICSMPVAIYQLWSFVAPGLRENEKQFAVTVVFWSTLLFLVGGTFAFFAVIPQMLTYFMSYANDGLEPLPKLSQYLTFVARTILAFGLSFQIPFLMVMSSKAGLVQAAYFRKKRMYFYIAIIFLSFLLTAGDFMATTLLAIPLFFLYEAGIFLSKLFKKRQPTAK
ncbi:twin-arginine translocase subunit TatC [Desulforhopalus sp. IMCC35007]|uniref:twin-arginine translocase subunit TatC n=1 Tax=Desulforhopalus sp. IMCC35007 TaxID=2569543 RepID=UPI0010ADD3A4|nr:twin-arginine translocase subunit TatC [Desulforhopalus sp. IMCC35007]TKB09368.1 twin-arginine translocase subunit TatC [Desulforhopalus sp. IMCC35007]